MMNGKVAMFVALFMALTLLYCKTRKRSATPGDQLLNSPVTDDVVDHIFDYLSDRELGRLARVTPVLSNGKSRPLLKQRHFEKITKIISELRAKDYKTSDNWFRQFGEASDEQVMRQFLNGFDGPVQYMLFVAIQTPLHLKKNAEENADSMWMQAKIMELKRLLHAYKAQYVDRDGTDPMRLECDNKEFMSFLRECNELIGSMEHVAEKNDYALMYVAMYSANLKKLMEAIAVKIGVAGMQRDPADEPIEQILEASKVGFGSLKQMISTGEKSDKQGEIEAMEILKENEPLIDKAVALVQRLEEYVARLQSQ